MMALRVFLTAALAVSCITAVDGTIENSLSLLKERLRVLERRLSEDVSLIRKELYSEIRNVKGSYNTTSMPAEIKRLIEDVHETYEADTIEDVKRQINDLHLQLNVLQDGFQVEKLSRRDVKEQLHQVKLNEIDIVQTLNDVKDTMELKFDQLMVRNITATLEEIRRALVTPESSTCTGCNNEKDELRANDCAELFRKGHSTNGVYEIYPDNVWRPLYVYCDMTTDGGGWTVFQRRCDGSENFYRSWNDYRFGFGNLSSEFWLGNEFIHRVMAQAPQELRIELEDFENDRRYAHYKIFELNSVDDLYKMHLEDFSGNVTDSLIASHNNQQFSTFDKGPSAGCAKQFKAGFWYSNCHAVNINGEYLKGEHKSYANGVNWKGFRGYHYSLKFTEMKFRSK